MEQQRMGDAEAPAFDQEGTKGEEAEALPEPGFTPAFSYEPSVVNQYLHVEDGVSNEPLRITTEESKDKALGVTEVETPEPGFTSAFLYEPTQLPASTNEQLSAIADHESPASRIDHESTVIATQLLEASRTVETDVLSDDTPNEDVTTKSIDCTGDEWSQTSSLGLKSVIYEVPQSNAQDSKLWDHENRETQPEAVSADASAPEPNLSAESVDAPPISEASKKAEDESPGPNNYPNEEEVPAIQTISGDSKAKAPSFFSSLGGSFAPEIQSAWSQVFGSRYEDDTTTEVSTETTHGNPNATAHGRESLKARLARERRLDAQIQACQERGRARTASTTTKPAEGDRPAHTTAASRKQNAPAPLENVGLSLTRMRFCVEHALRSTCLCFQDLYTLCMENEEETEPPATGTMECGVYVTQYELERLLQTLSRDPSVLAHTDAEPTTQHIPLTTLLQASWFLPFNHFSRLRSLVLQITRKHLNEQKLALLNRQLQKQILLQPLPLRLQQLLQQISNPNGDPTPAHFPLRPLLEAIAVSVEPNVANFIPQREFMELAPVRDLSTDGLMQRLGISSVLTLQRVVFFRFLLTAMTTERRRRTTCTPQKQQPKPKTDLSASQTRPKSKQATRKRRLKPSTASNPKDDRDGDSEQHNTNDQSSTSLSVAVTRGSLSPDSNTQKSRLSTDPDETPATNVVEDPREQRIRWLHQQLMVALDKMRTVNPWIEDPNLAAQNLPLAPAIKATYVAASAFHQSIALMLSQKLPLDPDMEQQLQELVVSLSETLNQTEEPSPKKAQRKSPSREAADPALAVLPRVPRATPSIFPPPYLERPREPPDPIFPPVYVSTRPSSWHFKPEFPGSPSSNQPPVQPAPLSTLKPPGVGSYDVQRSDPLRFSQTPSFSFAAESSTPPNRSSSSSKKPSICKTSLARAVAIARSPAAVSTSVHERLVTPEDDRDVDQQLQDALRLQQKLFMEHLVHDLVVPQPTQKPQQPSRSWRKTQSRLVDRIRQSVNVSADPEPLPSWAERKQSIASATVSPAKLRQQKAKSKAKSSKPDVSVAPVAPQSPLRDGEDPPDDDHLAWAARIRESYQQRSH